MKHCPFSSFGTFQQCLGHFGTSFGTWDFCIFGTFWDISGHQQNKNPRNLVQKPLRRAIDRSKPTNRTRYVRVTYGHFKTFWDISGHPLSMCTNDRSSIQPRRVAKHAIQPNPHASFWSQRHYFFLATKSQSTQQLFFSYGETTCEYCLFLKRPVM